MYEMYVRLWKLGGANNFIFEGEEKDQLLAGRSGSMKKVLYFVTTPKVNSK